MTDESIQGIEEFRILCPYCDSVLVRDFDWSDIEEDDIDSAPEPDWGMDCPHVAVFRVWSYIDAEMRASWTDEVNRLTAAIAEERDEDEEAPTLDDLLDNLVDQQEDCPGWVASLIPGIEATLIDEYLEKGAGPRGGGPTFTILLMNRRAIEVGAEKSHKEKGLTAV